MVLVSRAQNLITQITPQWFKALNPLTKTVLCVGGSALAALAIWFFRSKPAPSLIDRVKYDAGQFHQIRVLNANEHLKVDIKNNRIMQGGTQIPTAEEVNWLKSFAGEMVVHLDGYKKYLTAARNPQTDSEGMGLAVDLRTSLIAAKVRFEKLPASNDKQALLESTQAGIKKATQIIKSVGLRIPLAEPILHDTNMKQDVATELLALDEPREFKKENYYPPQYVRDFPLLGEFFINDKVYNKTNDIIPLGESVVHCLSGGGVADQGVTRLAAYRLYKLLVNSHYERSHNALAKAYFAKQGFNCQPVSKNLVKLRLLTNTKEPLVVLHLVKVYRATSTIADPTRVLDNPPALIVKKKFNISLQDLQKAKFEMNDFSVSVEQQPYVNLEVAQKKFGLKF